MCSDGYRLAAQPQGVLLICIWRNLVKLQGGGGGASKFDLLQHWDAVFLCSLHASDETLLLMSQSAIKLAVVGPRFFEQVCFGLYLGDQWQ